MEYTKAEHPESIPQLFVQAWNERDAAQIASLFDEDAEFVNVTGLWWHDRAAIEKAHAYGLQTIFQHSTLKLLRTKVKYLSEEIAVVHARMQLSGQSPVAGVEQPGTRRNIFSFVVHRQDGLWRCASAQNTDILPKQETLVRDEKGRLRGADYRSKL
ncbi:MAG: YybH family protein [Cyclobacteriaceae bacterium]